MGREWYWGGYKFSKRSGREKDNGVSTASGCMCAVFQLFDFPQFHFSTLHHHQQQPSILQTHSSLLPLEDPPVPKGVEAPRNSLELEESQDTSSFMSSSREDESLNISMGIQIKTNIGDISTRSKKAHAATAYAASDCSSEISSSPGTKTPNLVARLMGLDLLPENNNLSSSSTTSLNTPNLQHEKSHLHHFRRKHHLHQSNKPIPHRNSVDGSFPGTRSLPETPRISSARRSDVDLHHRLSLQINKENLSPAEELVLSRISSLRRLKEVRGSEDNESRSPSHYARQIVKQVTESFVGRKVGKDITNTVRNRAENATKEELVSRFKSKKLSKMGLTNNAVVNVEDLSSPGKQSTTCSPRLKFPEIKNKENYYDNNNNINYVVSHPPKASLSTSSHGNNVAQNDKFGSNKPKLSQLQVQHHQQQQQGPVTKCKKVKEEKFGTVPQSRLKKPPQTSDTIRNKQEEPFVIRPTLASNIPEKKCKKTPLSNLSKVTSVPTLLPVKKDPTPPATKIPLKQVPSIAQESKRGCSQLSSCSSRSYNQVATRTFDVRDIVSNTNNNNDNKNNDLNGGCCSVGDDEANDEYGYVTRIFRRSGIHNRTRVSFTRWFSPSHPLDPSIFHNLENFISLSPQHFVSGQLSLKCNRMLLFHLVDEILVEILKPYINLKPWSRQHFIGRGEMFQGSHLVSTLCRKIKSYPRADCRVLEDIDGIIDKDLGQMKNQSEMAFEEEAEWIVTEIEKDILDSLVHETVLTF